MKTREEVEGRIQNNLSRRRCCSAALVMAGLIAIGAGSAEARPSFYCRGRLNPAERTICDSSYLGKLDRKMAREYHFQMGELSRRERRILRRDQRKWLRDRNRCRYDEECLDNLYNQRIEELVEWGL